MKTQQESSSSGLAAFRHRCSTRATEVLAHLRGHPWTCFAFIAALAMTGTLERLMGRSWLGPDGRFGFWESDIWSSECSQRLADAYSCSHFVHGILFYAGLWVIARKLPVRSRLMMAVLLEAGWELLENSPIIINRYRQTTIALGYDGDSILNSLSDIVTMALGFAFAWRMRPWITLALVLVLEIGCALWVRDNLTLNIIMLLHPVEAIKTWQMGARPPM
jgi:hypothetical protein